MSFKKTTIIALLAFGVNLPSLASAGDLVVTNHTKLDSTSIINRGPCSTILGEIGITRAGQTNVIPENKVRLACFANSSNCQADVYMTTYCNSKGDAPIATVIFDTKTGIKSVEMKNSAYAITGTGFNIVLSGGPVFIAKK